MILLLGQDSAQESDTQGLRAIFSNAALSALSFKLQNLYEAQLAAMLMAQGCSHANLVEVGITELIFNAIEHGNLGISYDDKTKLFKTEHWVDEIERRLKLPENAHKFVTVHFSKNDDQIRVRIKDEGAGFNWSKFDRVHGDRAFDSHGRGIILAQNVAFKDIIYHGNGSEVECVISLLIANS